MRYFDLPVTTSPEYQSILAAHRVDEATHVRRLCETLTWSEATKTSVRARARALVATVRKERSSGSGVDALMQEYQLSSQEGVVLMCLAEALLRIPDTATIDLLIEDKLAAGDWEQHLGHSDSLFVNASTWGLMLSGKLLRVDMPAEKGKATFRSLLQRCGEPVVRQAVRHAMKILARQFVTGRTIKEALARSQKPDSKAYRFSYDMLGEAARTQADSQRYFDAYAEAIHAIGAAAKGLGPMEAPGISVKLSALHPRFEFSQAGRLMKELVPRVCELAKLASQYNIGLTIDAEESERLDLTLTVLERVALDPALGDWNGLGLAVQSYQKRAYDLIDWLAALAQRSNRRLMVRLVKGAYWDSEIKRAQELGLDHYPVFTRKQNTDVSYLACAQKMLTHVDCLYPQFATHNAYTVAAILELAGSYQDFEFQRLHGMGGPLYGQLMGADQKTGVSCRVYAPVGSHEDLLPYLVRRLLENGANTSFVNRIMDDQAPIETLITNPVAQVLELAQIPHPQIPLPADILPGRKNSSGLDLSDTQVLEQLQRQWSDKQLAPLEEATATDIENALAAASEGFANWDATDVEVRASCLERMAELMEENMPRLMALCTQEAGKTLADGVAEVREAVDFCRYYANSARESFQLRSLPGPTGEQNQWRLRGRGVFVCISPWNFPLAIFTGQVCAALVAGNTVVAKPAAQTPAIAQAATELLYEAGVPRNVLHLLVGGAEVGAALVRDTRVAGVAFTGSTATARKINVSLAQRDAAIAKFIAETGGVNAMVVDSSALLEQVVVDVLQSGFQSAGQRCSALRLLLVQEDVAPALCDLLKGAMDELHIGDPADLATDVGPVIDGDALAMLHQHSEHLTGFARLQKQCVLPDDLPAGHYFPPMLTEIDEVAQLPREVFGPIVHMLRYSAADLDQVIDAINASGYGLTFGVHSRIDSRARYIASRIRAGNVYVNRNMIGAVVGVQPFGGTGLSGTGPKAGGPHYVAGFAVEQSVSTDTTAAGGNASLMSLSSDDAIAQDQAGP